MTVTQTNELDLTINVDDDQPLVAPVTPEPLAADNGQDDDSDEVTP
jgi:hypothetical protein